MASSARSWPDLRRTAAGVLGASTRWAVVEIIGSIKDERIAAARALATRSGRVAAGRCLIEGLSLVRQTVSGVGVDFVLHASGADPAPGEELVGAGVPVYGVREGLLRKITGGAKPVEWLAVAVLPVESGPDVSFGDFTVVWEGGADPGNLGTIVRTAHALGVRDIVLTDEATRMTCAGGAAPLWALDERR